MPRSVSFGKEEREEILLFDILYRINAQKHGKTDLLLNRADEMLSERFAAFHSQGFLETSEGHYVLSQKGKAQLEAFGVMFQRFKDLSIFKCVIPDAPPPEPGSPDARFGSYHEHPDPPHSEDYRLLIFENFCLREGRHPPLHLFVFFSLVEDRRPAAGEDDWVWDLASGTLFETIAEIIHSQPTADDIAPEGLDGNGIVDAIYQAGMAEMKRCFERDRHKFNPEVMDRDRQDFWVEETVEESHRGPDHHHDAYYDPYYDPYPSAGAAFCVGAFAGLATCYLLS